MSKTLNFKSKAKFKKWLAYGHIHDVFTKHRKAGKYPKVKIRGRKHKVQHK